MPREKKRTVGAALKRLRKLKGLDDADVAEKLGRELQTVRNQESRAGIRFSTLERHLAAMGATLREFADAYEGLESEEPLVEAVRRVVREEVGRALEKPAPGHAMTREELDQLGEDAKGGPTPPTAPPGPGNRGNRGRGRGRTKGKPSTRRPKHPPADDE